MIREFTEGRRILFFPVRWANAVARWIAGIHSKSGTVQITNTLSPGADGSLSIDVDMEAVASKVKSRLGFDRESPVNRSEVKNIVFDIVDGASIINSGRRISVNQKWLAQQVASSGSSSVALSSDTPQAIADTASAGSSSQAARSDHVHNLNIAATFKIKAIKNSSGTATGMQVYVADAAKAAALNGTACTINGVNAGWNSRAHTGGLYLNQTAAGATTFAFANAATSTANCFSIYIGSVASNGTVTQNVLGAIDVLDGRMGLDTKGTIAGPEDAESMSGYNDTWTNGTHKPHNSSTTTAGVGITIPVCTGGAVVEGGFGISLYYRLLTFDRSGRLYSVGAETQELAYTS